MLRDDKPVTDVTRGAVFDKVRKSEGRMLTVWSPEECEALKDLVARMRRIEGEVVDGEAGIARMLKQAYDN